MHITIDYSISPSPKFDAIEHIKEWLGQERWDKISPEMSKIKDHAQFQLIASFGGVQGFPVKAWYELYHGDGSWTEPNNFDG